MNKSICIIAVSLSLREGAMPVKKAGKVMGEAGNFFNTAITIQNPGNYTSNFKIYRNTINGCRIGIHARRVKGIKIGDDGANKIHFYLGETPATNKQHKGIWLQNCNDAHITGEGDSGNPDIENDKEITTTGTTNFRGIDIENSANARINCNVINNLPRSIYFTGDCNLSKMRLNRFENFENGVGLLNNNAILPPQGENPGTGFIPYDNTWVDGTISAEHVHRDNEPNPNPIAWYHDGQGIHDPTPSNTVFLPPPTSTGCNCACNTYTRETDRDNSIGNIIWDSLAFDDNAAEMAYQAKMNVFLAMKEDSTLIYKGAANDSLYLAFYNSMLGSNMNRLDSVSILSRNNLLEDARALNTDITDTNYVEYYLKTVYAIYLNGPAQDSALSAGDSTTLEEIAYLPVNLAGNSVYMAAAMLGLEIHQEGSGGESRAAASSNTPAAIKEPIGTNKFYPNPANHTVYFFLNDVDLNEKNVLKIYDGQGKMAVSKTVTGRNLMLDVISFPPGIYRFNVCTSERIVFKGNFAVIH